MDRLHLISVFVAVVDANGFAGAARKLKISPPAVTRAINELETHLGIRLLTRTTRVVRVTEAGARYAEDCRAILAQLAEADEFAAGLHDVPRGRLTVTAPIAFGTKYVTPVLVEYLEQYPALTASCWFMDRVVDMIDEGVDVAVRIGELPDSSMQAIRVGSMRLVVIASPDYLEAHGTPRTPQELAKHTVVTADGVTPAPEWSMSVAGTPRNVKLQPRLIASNSETAIAAVVGGFGLTNVLLYKVAEDIRNGRLQQVLREFEPPPLPVHVLHREGRHASRKARGFIDLAVERLRPQLIAL